MNGDSLNRLVGYARVSTHDQDLSLQLDSLESHGIPKHLLFVDKISGAKEERPGLNACREELREGDTLIVWRLDRLGRSMRHLVNMIEDLKQRGIGFRSISDGMIDTTSASGELIYEHLFSLGPVRATSNSRTNEGWTGGCQGSRESRRTPADVSRQPSRNFGVQAVRRQNEQD